MRWIGLRQTRLKNIASWDRYAILAQENQRCGHVEIKGCTDDDENFL